MFDKDIIYKKYNLKPDDCAIRAWGSRPETTVEQLIDYLIEYDKEAIKYLGISLQSLRSYVKKLFPDINLRGLSNRSWESWFLQHTNLKRCCSCKEILLRDLYSKDKYTPDGLKHECKLCVKDRTNTEEHKLKWSEYNKWRYKENLEYNRQWRQNYYQRNKEKYFAATAKRKAAKLQAIPIWADLKAIQKFY